MLHITTCFLLSLVCVFSASHAQVALRPIAAGEAARFGVSQMRVSFAGQKPTIDGRDEDALWEQTPVNIFVNAIDGGSANPATTVQTAYDAEFLYVYIRAVEAGQETHLHGSEARQDPAVHQADAAEIFLQPGGPDTPYFQIAANPRGGYIDYQWSQPGAPISWNSENLKVAGHIDFDFWALEVAIPFADLGVEAPTPASRWRANFCRNELPGHLLYGAWSFTGGGFQAPERFGILDFAGEVDGANTALATLKGQVIDGEGKTLSDVPVKALGRVARSDTNGHFTFSDVPTGEQVLSVIAPQYAAVHGLVAIEGPITELAPIVLERIDPYRPAWSLPTGDKPGAWLSSSIEEPPDMVNAPLANTSLAELNMMATPGEYETVALAYYANHPAEAPRITCTPLQTADGKVLQVVPRVRWTQRLLKRQHYQTSVDQSEFVWRFLWDEPPAAIAAGQLRQLAITVLVPADAAPGLYRSTMQLQSSGRAVAQIELRLRVLPFKLAAPDQRVGTYFNFARGFDDEGTERMLRDIRAHGGDAIMWWMGPNIKEEDGRLVPDLSSMRHRLRMLHRNGFAPPFIVNTGAEALARRLGIGGQRHAPDPKALRASGEYRETYARFLQAIGALEHELGIGAFALSWSDEIFQEGRLEPWLYTAALTREHSDHPIYITHHSGDPAKIERIDPYLDIRCYHGRKLDDDLAPPRSYDELTAELAQAGDTAWAYYNIVRTDITPEYTRLVNGYWLWRTPVSVHVPWTYYAGKPDGLVGVWKAEREAPFFAFAAPHPTKAEMVSTLDWECFREGYDDLRYIATLEAAIENAPGEKEEIVQRARGLLDTWWAADPRVPVQAATLTTADYQLRRGQMAEFIEALADNK